MSEPSESTLVSHELPRLRIFHLLVLATIFSLFMAMNIGVVRLLGRGDEILKIDNGTAMQFILDQLLASVCVAMVGLGLAWRKRGLAFPSQPGHWVAMYWTLATLSNYGGSILWGMSQANGAFDLAFWMAFMSFIFGCLTLALWFFAYRNEPASIWKWGWVAMSLHYLRASFLAGYHLFAVCFKWLLGVDGLAPTIREWFFCH